MPKKNIGLDDLFNEQPVVDTNDTGVTDLVIAPTVKKERKQAKETSANSIFEKYSLLLYMVDTSGSMADSCVEDGEITYDWPSDSNFKNYLSRVLENTYGRSEEVLAFKETIHNTAIKDLKIAMLTIGPEQFSIYPKHDSINTKMNLVKKSIADLVDRRYDKDPDAKIVMGTFEMEAYISASTREHIKIELNNMHPGGGTSIINALNVSLAYFEKNPSPVNVHHLVLITDGEDWNGIEAKNLLPRIKELGVTLDYIFIKNRGQVSEGASAVAKVFTEICRETGGDYVEVDSPSQFEKKLILASNRLCLPPGA